LCLVTFLTTMHSTQAAFEELIATSHPRTPCDPSLFNETIGLNILARGVPIKSSNSSVPAGIDDFLAHYTLQSRSIHDFMSCLDEPETECSVDNSNADRVIVPCSSQNTSSVRCSTPFTLAQEEGKATAAVHDRPGRKSPKAKSSTICKRVKLTPEQRDERRREQNREAQRRFREKQMFQPHRNSFTHPYTLTWANGPIFHPHH
jgi:hypothetical protein